MFRFTIRDVLWLTVVVACLSAWAVDHFRLAEQSHRHKASADLWQYRAGAVVDSMSDTGWAFDWVPGGVEVQPPKPVE